MQDPRKNTPPGLRSYILHTTDDFTNSWCDLDVSIVIRYTSTIKTVLVRNYISENPDAGVNRVI